MENKMKTDDLVSIIVPVYNVQEYLKACIDSILDQSYKNIEIILVDDGSTDRSVEICDQYAKIDERVKVIHQKNGGVSSARNKGLEQSSGSYIAFIDSDDTIDKDFITVLYNGFDKSIDMTVCAFEIVESQHNTKSQNNSCDMQKNIVLSREETVDTILHGKPFAGHCCNKMFRKNVLSDIKFPNGIYVYEDTMFVLEYLLRGNNVLYVDRKLYKYYIRNESASHGKMSDKKLTAFTALERIEQKLNLLYDKRFLTKVNYNRLMWTIYCYNLLAYDKPNRKTYGPFLKRTIKAYRKNPLLSNKTKIKIGLLLACSPMYYCAVKIANKTRNSQH